MEELITRYGLAAVYLVSMVEGDVALVLGGVVAHLGLLHLSLAMAAGAGGCFTADLACYFIARHRSDAITGTRAYRAVGPTVDRIATRVGPWQIAASRLIYGTRIVTMLYWGTRRLPLAQFATIDLVSCAAWAVTLGALGYVTSKGAMAVLGEVKQAEIWLLFIAGAVIVGVMAAKLFIARARRRRQEEQ